MELLFIFFLVVMVKVGLMTIWKLIIKTKNVVSVRYTGIYCEDEFPDVWYNYKGKLTRALSNRKWESKKIPDFIKNHWKIWREKGDYDQRKSIVEERIASVCWEWVGQGRCMGMVQHVVSKCTDINGP